MTKIRRLYQRLHALPKRTGSTADLQRILSSVDIVVGDHVGGGPIIEKLVLSAMEPTSGFEPLTPAHYE
jgi:hypothetical protein